MHSAVTKRLPRAHLGSFGRDHLGLVQDARWFVLAGCPRLDELLAAVVINGEGLTSGEGAKVGEC